MPVSWGEDRVVFGACHAAVLSLLRLRRFWGRVQFCTEDREHYLPGIGAPGGAEAEYSAAEDHVFKSGRGQGSQAAYRVAGSARTSLRVFSGVPEETGRRAGAGISAVARTGPGDDREVSRWIRARLGIFVARPLAGRIRRRGFARERVVFLEGEQRPGTADSCRVHARPQRQAGCGKWLANYGRPTTHEHVLQVPQPRDVSHQQR